MANWVDSMFERGITPQMLVLFVAAPGVDSLKWERFFIEVLRPTGQLLNRLHSGRQVEP